MTVNCLILSCGISKEKKIPFVTFRYWDEKFSTWKTEKRGDVYVDLFKFVSNDEYNYISSHIGEGLVLPCEVVLNESLQREFTDFVL